MPKMFIMPISKISILFSSNVLFNCTAVMDILIRLFRFLPS